MNGTIYCFDPRNGGHCYRNLSGAEEDAALLAAVVADAQATQSIHKEMLQRVLDWEERQPGVISTDDDLRNQFIANLEGLRSAFTDRVLKTVGVAFPAFLDRANPAHAVIIAVRDDIADTRDRLQENKAQALVGKQVADTRISLSERLARQAADAARELTSSAAGAVAAGGKGLSDAIKSLGWIVGGGFGIYLVYQMTRGGK